MKEIKDIVAAYAAIEREGKQAVLATVVHVEGSSYRSPGARMLISEEGELTGAISGGCLEGDALRKALLVLQQQKPMLATYDTSDEDDAVIGVGLGCNGIIRVLLEPLLPFDPSNPIHLLREAIKKREELVLIAFFSLHDKWSELQGTRLLVRKNAEIPPLPFLAGVSLKEEVDLVFDHQCAQFLITHTVFQEEIHIFIEYMPPNIALIIGGAGNDVFPLVQLATLLGWEITLVDGRPNYANERRFANCTLVIAAPEQALAGLTIDARTAFVLMSHNYHYDKGMLGFLAAYEVPYIGILGPKKKTERMIQELKEEDVSFSYKQLLRLFGPTGLDIGAETPAEIALAIVAEIKAVFSGRQGRSLRDKIGSIHRKRNGLITAPDALK